MKKRFNKLAIFLVIITIIVLIICFYPQLRTIFDKLSNFYQQQTTTQEIFSQTQAENNTSQDIEISNYEEALKNLSHEQFNGEDAFEIINENVPFFTKNDIKITSFEFYSELDTLGRCGMCIASIGKDLMPTTERESISSVYPSGWKYNGKSNNKQYDFVDAKWIYNRCHLIGFQLTGENANKNNLITGTRFLNIDGMISFENMIADIVKEKDIHVMYRVTPIFKDDNLLCEGLLLEGYSVEDKGQSIEFCVFSFNVQPGVLINYKTGENYSAEETRLLLNMICIIHKYRFKEVL